MRRVLYSCEHVTKVERRVVKKLTLLVLAVLIAAAGCTKKPVVQKESAAEPMESIEPADTAGMKIAIEAVVSAIDVFDDRRGVEEPERLLHMPDWTIVGQGDAIRPALFENHRDIILDETQSHFSPGTKEVFVEVYVLEGKQTYVAGERREKVTAEFAVRIEIANVDATHDVKTGTGRAKLEKEELEVTYADVNALYEAAIRESIRDALANI
jgi:hypothetical protein